MSTVNSSIIPSSSLSLEYDERFAVVEAAWNDEPTEQDAGSTGRNAPDWERVASDAEALLAESADLRLACWVLRANLKCKGLQALFSGTAGILNLLDTFGPHLHPMADEGHPASAHASALAWLGTPRCLHDIASARVSPDDARSFRDVIERHDPQLDANGLDGNVLRDTALMLETIELRVNEHATDYTVDFAPLVRLLRSAMPADDRDAAGHVRKSESEEGFGEDAASPAGRGCRTREDAHRMLDSLVEYFRINEPSHPAPIFLRRIQKTMGMDFASIVNELIPEAAPDLSRLIGA